MRDSLLLPRLGVDDDRTVVDERDFSPSRFTRNRDAPVESIRERGSIWINEVRPAFGGRHSAERRPTLHVTGAFDSEAITGTNREAKVE